MSLSSKKNDDYGVKEYWDARYENDEEFEWCKDYNLLEPLLTKYIKPQDAVLMLGCGNSELSSDMYNDGISNITNIDFSSVVVAKMRDKFPCMKWMTMDMLDLQFPEDTFDIVIEKCTLDVLFVKETSPWTTSKKVAADMHKVLSGVSKVLKPEGKFISITFSQPHFRSKFYKEYWKNVENSSFGNGFHYYFNVSSNL